MNRKGKFFQRKQYVEREYVGFFKFRKKFRVVRVKRISMEEW